MPSTTTVSGPVPCTLSRTSCSPDDTAPSAATQAVASCSTGGGCTLPGGAAIRYRCEQGLSQAYGSVRTVTGTASPAARPPGRAAGPEAGGLLASWSAVLGEPDGESDADGVPAVADADAPSVPPVPAAPTCSRRPSPSVPPPGGPTTATTPTSTAATAAPARTAVRVRRRGRGPGPDSDGTAPSAAE